MSFGLSIGSKGYFGTGYDNITPQIKDFWEYDPNGNGISETELENSISVYPNPTGGKANLSISKLEDWKIKEIEVYNINGEKTYTAANFQIDLSSQPDGIYFLQITADPSTGSGQNITKKILLNR